MMKNELLFNILLFKLCANGYADEQTTIMPDDYSGYTGVENVLISDPDSGYADDIAAFMSAANINNTLKYYDLVVLYIEECWESAMIKWRAGLEIQQPQQDNYFLEIAKNQSAELRVPWEKALQAVSDLLSTARIIETVLTLNWYAADYFEDRVHPYFKESTELKVRRKQSHLQFQIIALLRHMADLQNSTTCVKNMALMLAFHLRSENMLTKVGMQRAVAHFCEHAS